MKFGLWFLPAVAIGAVGTLLAASLPVPPSLPNITMWHAMPGSTLVAAGAGPLAAVVPPTPPAATAKEAAARSLAPAIEPPKRAAATVAATRSPGSGSLPRRPARRLARATPDHHPRGVAHPVGPHYGAIVAAPPAGPYPGMPAGMPLREPTQIAMAPPPYGMPAPYWRAPYRPY